MRAGIYQERDNPFVRSNFDLSLLHSSGAAPNRLGPKPTQANPCEQGFCSLQWSNGPYTSVGSGDCLQ